MANIRVTCPACKTVLEIDKKFEGEQIECGNCLEEFKAERPKKGDGDDQKIVVMLLPGVVPRNRDDKSGRKRKRRRNDGDDDDDDYAPPPPRPSGGPGDGAAVASLILGVIAFVTVCCWPLSITLSVLAVALGSAGMKSRSNKALAVTGLILGVLVLSAVGMLFAGFAGGFGPFWFR